MALWRRQKQAEIFNLPATGSPEACTQVQKTSKSTYENLMEMWRTAIIPLLFRTGSKKLRLNLISPLIDSSSEGDISLEAKSINLFRQKRWSIKCLYAKAALFSYCRKTRDQDECHTCYSTWKKNYFRNVVQYIDRHSGAKQGHFLQKQCKLFAVLWF